MKEKIAIISVGLIFFALGIFVGWTIFSATPEEPPARAENEEKNVETEVISEDLSVFDSEQLKTYRSRYGFAITFPKTWYTFNSIEMQKKYGNGGVPGLQEFYVSPENIPYGPGPVIQITVSIDSFENFIESKVSSFRKNISPVIINGYEGIQTHTNGPMGSKIYVFTQNNVVYSVIYTTKFLENYDVTKEQTDAVLSSFRLIDIGAEGA